GGLWLPVIWFVLVCSRYLSQWLALLGVHVDPVSQEDGSPIDAVVFGTIISLGLIVLAHRKIALYTLVRYNWWLTIFLVYSFLAIAWSDFPFVALKRWIKEL